MIFRHFIYVFCKEARDSLLKRGYTMVQEDARQRVWVFENKSIEESPFPDDDYAFVLSDTLSI